MSFFAPCTSSLQSIERVGQSAIRNERRYASFFCYAHWLMSRHGPCISSCSASIHILDDDSLLHVFYLYRPFLLGEDQDDTRLFGREKGWVRGHGPPSYVAQRFLMDATLGRDASLRIVAVMNDQFQLNSILFNKPSLPFPSLPFPSLPFPFLSFPLLSFFVTRLFLASSVAIYRRMILFPSPSGPGTNWNT